MAERKSLLERWWTKWKRNHETGCWEWTASKNYFGYGRIGGEGGRKGGTLKAHRVAWQIFYGTIPAGLCVLHKCDVASCVNPDHLWLGTKRDNTLDMITKGRGLRGQKNGHAKLTPGLVPSLRQEYARGGTTHQALADRSGLTRQGMTDVLSGRNWTHIE